MIFLHPPLAAEDHPPKLTWNAQALRDEVMGKLMSDTLAGLRKLVRRGEIRVSRHGFRELAADEILLHEVAAGIETAIAIEDYPDAIRGPSVLVLQHDENGRPLHVVWGVQQGTTGPAVLITAYRPDPLLWSADFTRRSKR